MVEMSDMIALDLPDIFAKVNKFKAVFYEDEYESAT
jgi:hypothetical protein